MKHVEFSNYPPAFEIAQLNGSVVIRFYCDVNEITKEDLSTYSATCYEMTTRQSANLKQRIEQNYDMWLAKAKEIDGGLDALKSEKIALSKIKLAEYLASHPLVSTAHGNKSGTYSVTEEKQALMTSQYISYQAEKTINPDAKLTWNETGKSCEVWTEAEFLQLVIEIKGYVYPLVSHQQEIEEAIQAANGMDELESIVIDYGTIA